MRGRLAQPEGVWYTYRVPNDGRLTGEEIPMQTPDKSIPPKPEPKPVPAPKPAPKPTDPGPVKPK